jgi:hypothetical protein
MLRGIAVTACLVSACAARPGELPKVASPAQDPDLALSAIVLTPTPAFEKARPRRVGRLSPPFALGASSRNVLARATEADERNFAAR